MSRTLAGLAALAIAAAPAAAGYGFDATYTGASIPVISALNISVKPELVDETSFVTQRRDGGQYIAPSDAEDLVEDLRDELADTLGAANVYQAATGGATLNVVIEEATPSNPAHTENGRNAGLDFRSFGRGGATVVAELVAADGTKLADFSYRWEESSFDVESLPRIGWYGAERAFDRFASRLARDLAAHNAGAAS